MDRPAWLRAPNPRVLDGSLLVGVGFVLATGVVSLFSGRPSRAWVFLTHGVGGLVLAGLVGLKLRRVRHRVGGARHSAVIALSVLLAVVTVGAIGSGVAWVFGASLDLGPWGLLNLHVGLGLAVGGLLAAHLVYRFRLPGRSDIEGRRTALRYTAAVLVGAAAYRLQASVNDAAETAGADRRFTGSREDGSDDGNAFPVTSWMADDPDPVDAASWSLTVDGAVAEPTELEYPELVDDDERRALLDCTSGWYSEHDWTGVSVASLLDAVDPDDDAAWVQFRSVTGYRWSLPIEEARGALLATAVDGEGLDHGHGFPLRLVAPGRRGFQWVKWVEAVRVTRRRDHTERLAIFVSGFG
ncbi:molybdopterin-dependent oxidoreductase [Natronomonas marina]|uniref:molybdopterin-dependent oxidoreductase n=1 Tax=Natronomonas marina TaxID=2961939 RepID=UPI0020C9F5FB|nr:molybdopterin-dependent oxidoreductase [Natronomonas marina]